jgi:hypothetical protein
VSTVLCHWIDNEHREMCLRPSPDAEWTVHPMERVIVCTWETESALLVCYDMAEPHESVVAAFDWTGRLLWEKTRAEIPLDVGTPRSCLGFSSPGLPTPPEKPWPPPPRVIHLTARAMCCEIGIDGRIGPARPMMFYYHGRN